MAQVAKEDLRDLLEWSADRFGTDAMERYKSLIATALNDVAEDPDQPGRRKRPELGRGNGLGISV
ncbi:MAG TPA: type II toxin-antitoxin system RelE/ParE family toxin [Candidatus Corynebacterium avicola]|uniref:Type II toxin-antitoxin system RelE/ParE family toxin n=1 Tax=Candidatus Corynebacterium avicola TaxID=2838527 RepID=A0A9D1RPD9_9CORY|nr:type II toxin-antitoxin system RelE/ParE family toxin [Candidatus Corynebacterium avicola]